jgi:signal transduction histidine kinase/PAS domain-containing protein/ActR/RegA family two-component response regulator
MIDQVASLSGDEALRRLAFLARAGEVLASSLDYDETLQEVARLAIPALGDLCIVDIVEGAVLRRVATTHVVPAKIPLVQELRQRYPPLPGSAQPASRVARSGRHELLEAVTPDVVAAHTIEPEHARLIQAIGIRSHLAVPMVARGTIVGVLNLGVTESDRRYGPDDVALAQDLARRAAVAVDNARLYALAQHEIAVRRTAEATARVSEERFRAIMEQSPLSTQILAPNGETVRVNGAWEALWGLSLEHLAGYNMLADPQLEAKGITPLLRRAFAGEPVDLPAIQYDPEETLPDKSHHANPARWVRAFAYPVKDAHGVVREVVLVHEDITEARQAEEQLRASEERLRMALTAGRMNVWDWNLITDVVECSENAQEFWGRAIGRAADFLAAIHPEDLQHAHEAAALAIAGDRYSAEYRLVRPGGKPRWVHSRGRVERAADGRAVRVLGVTVDISDLKDAEETTRVLADAGEKLGASLDYQATLQDLARTVVPRIADWCTVDLLTEGDALERVVVHHPDPARLALAHELFVRFPPRRSDPYGAWNVVRTQAPEWAGSIDDEQLRQAARDPEHLALLRRLELRSYISVPLTARGSVIGVLTVVHAESGRCYSAADVALVVDLARRAAAAVDNARLYERLRAEDRRKDEFLATLAHELRNPLAPIRTGLALLKSAGDPDMQERTRQVMERQVSHMTRLIDDLLDLSRVTRGMVPLERERIDMWSIVAAALEASRPSIDAAGVELMVRLPEAPIVLWADRTRLSQVLSNLLNNAAKFTPPGGRVELEAAADDASVLIRLRDTGVGIQPELLGYVFEMFAQVGAARERTQSGLGIGLTLVKRLVELHGGTVWAESEGLGRGSTFFVRLPRVAAASLESRAAPAVPDIATSVRRVLVVDDNADAAEMLGALLAVEGHDVRTATSGPAELAMIPNFRPDIAFLDIGMPGMSGYELARRLRDEPQLSGMALVAVTGWGQDEDRRNTREAGFQHHLTKPVDPRVVRTMVAEWRPDLD